MGTGGIIAVVVAFAVIYVGCATLASYLAARFGYDSPRTAGVIWPAFLACNVVLAAIFLLMLPFWVLDEAIELGRKHRERK